MSEGLGGGGAGPRMGQDRPASWGGLPSWPVTLRQGRVSLRPIRRVDARAWTEVHDRNDAWLRRWEATVPPGSGGHTPATFVQMAGDLRRQAREGRTLPWVVWYDPVAEGHPRGHGVLAGQLTVSGITRGSAQWAQLGYWVDERWAGRGIIPLAVAMATDFCLGPLGLHRMEIVIRPENVNSRRVVEKLGFRGEGLRPAYLHIDGDWRDHLVYALNAEEIGAGGLVGRLAATGRLQGLSHDSTDTPGAVTDR